MCLERRLIGSRKSAASEKVSRMRACVDAIPPIKCWRARFSYVIHSGGGLMARLPQETGCKLDRILIWKFARAPEALRMLYQGKPAPVWLALVPREMHDTDVDRAMIGQGLPGGIRRWETPNGDIVYAGSPTACILASADSSRSADIFEPRSGGPGAVVRGSGFHTQRASYGRSCNSLNKRKKRSYVISAT
jgi:hypothetical protein